MPEADEPSPDTEDSPQSPLNSANTTSSTKKLTRARALSKHSKHSSKHGSPKLGGRGSKAHSKVALTLRRALTPGSKASSKGSKDSEDEEEMSSWDSSSADDEEAEDLRTEGLRAWVEMQHGAPMQMQRGTYSLGDEQQVALPPEIFPWAYEYAPRESDDDDVDTVSEEEHIGRPRGEPGHSSSDEFEDFKDWLSTKRAAEAERANALTPVPPEQLRVEVPSGADVEEAVLVS